MSFFFSSPLFFSTSSSFLFSATIPPLPLPYSLSFPDSSTLFTDYFFSPSRKLWALCLSFFLPPLSSSLPLAKPPPKYKQTNPTVNAYTDERPILCFEAPPFPPSITNAATNGAPFLFFLGPAQGVVSGFGSKFNLQQKDLFSPQFQALSPPASACFCSSRTG